MTLAPPSFIRTAPARRVFARYSGDAQPDGFGLNPRIPLPFGTLDPFLLIDHHGPTTYAPRSAAPQVGAHPHRGFETVTFIIQGSLRHQDSTGFASVVHAPGVQWMTAGAGLYHDESLPADFLARGGTSEVIQLWLNLPPRLKMVSPRYQAAEAAELTHCAAGAEGVDLAIVAGKLADRSGPLETVTGAFVSTVTAAAGSQFSLPVPDGRVAMLYVVGGRVEVGGLSNGPRTLLDLGRDGEVVVVDTVEDATMLFCHADALGAPIAAEGPFVMNTQDELEAAFEDFRSGRVSKGALT